MKHPKRLNSEDRDDSLSHFQDSEYASVFLQGLRDLRAASLYTDVKLRALDGDTISCHRVALAAGSLYFRAMFASSFQESNSSDIVINCVASPTLHNVVKFLYSGEMDFTAENVQDIIQASDLLQMDSLKAGGERFMLSNMTPDNCLGFYSFAKMYTLPRLLKQSQQTMQLYFERVVQGSEFNELRLEELLRWLGRDTLTVSSEDIIMDAVLQWVKHDETGRVRHLVTLLRAVRLPYCTNDHLHQLHRKEPLLSRPECEAILSDILADQRPSTSKGTGTLEGLRPRYGFEAPRELIVIGGKYERNSGATRTADNNQAWKFSEDSHDWDKLSTLPSDFTFAVTASVSDHLLVIGNKGGRMSCWKFHVGRRKWKQIEESPMERTHFSCCLAAGEKLFILSGWRRTEGVMTTAEYLDWNSETWFNVDDMLEAVRLPAVAAYDQKVFAFGGRTNDSQAFGCMTQIYDTVLERWSRGQDSPTDCDLGAAVTVNDSIYVIGGFSKACMMYQPEWDDWTGLSRPLAQHGMGAAVLWQGKVLLGGGKADGDILTDQIEMYDPDADSWTEWEHRLDMALEEHALLSVKVWQ